MCRITCAIIGHSAYTCAATGSSASTCRSWRGQYWWRTALACSAGSAIGSMCRGECQGRGRASRPGNAVTGITREEELADLQAAGQAVPIRRLRAPAAAGPCAQPPCGLLRPASAMPTQPANRRRALRSCWGAGRKGRCRRVGLWQWRCSRRLWREQRWRRAQHLGAVAAGEGVSPCTPAEAGAGVAGTAGTGTPGTAGAVTLVLLLLVLLVLLLLVLQVLGRWVKRRRSFWQSFGHPSEHHTAQHRCRAYQLVGMVAGTYVGMLQSRHCHTEGRCASLAAPAAVPSY